MLVQRHQLVLQFVRQLALPIWPEREPLVGQPNTVGLSGLSGQVPVEDGVDESRFVLVPEMYLVPGRCQTAGLGLGRLHQ